MFAILIDDKTSKKVNRNNSKGNVESKIGSFAYQINNIFKAQELIELAEEAGLTLDPKLSRAYYDSYVTFGVDMNYDVSYENVSERTLKNRGVKVIDSLYEVTDRIVTMSDRKYELTLIDALRVGDKTYRELALGATSYVGEVEKIEKRVGKKAPKKSKRDHKELITISDHFVMTNNGDYAFKRPNDTIKEVELLVSY